MKKLKFILMSFAIAFTVTLSANITQPPVFHKYSEILYYDTPISVSSECSFETPYCFKINYQELSYRLVSHVSWDVGLMVNSYNLSKNLSLENEVTIAYSDGIMAKYKVRCYSMASFHFSHTQKYE